MAIRTRDVLKSWFQRGLKPLAAQFSDWIDSFWHRNDKIPMTSIEGLANTLNEKANTAALNGHISDTNNPHQVTAEQLGALTALKVHEGVGIKVTIEADGSITLDAEIDGDLFIPVLELPTTDIKENKIYLVPRVTPEAGNVLDEFIWINGDWELLGSVSVDLTNYYTKSEIAALLAAIPDTNFANTDLTISQQRTHTFASDVGMVLQASLSSGSYAVGAFHGGLASRAIGRDSNSTGMLHNFEEILHSFDNYGLIPVHAKSKVDKNGVTHEYLEYNNNGGKQTTGIYRFQYTSRLGSRLQWFNRVSEKLTAVTASEDKVEMVACTGNEDTAVVQTSFEVHVDGSYKGKVTNPALFNKSMNIDHEGNLTFGVMSKVVPASQYADVNDNIVYMITADDL